jgi:tetratricopeptide (TPR) repeat protein
MNQAQPLAIVPAGRHLRRATAISALCSWAEDAATRWQDSAVLAGLLRRSGRVFAMAGDPRQAERRWARAAEINRERWRAAGLDTETLEGIAAERQAVLDVLDVLYHQEKRLQHAVEVEVELVEVHRVRNDPEAVAHGLLRVGATLLAGQRLAEARQYLARADRAFGSLGEQAPLGPESARDHARTLELLATVHRHQGDPSAAEDCDRRAIQAAATPLVHYVDEVHDLRDTLTSLATQASAFVDDVAALATEVGEGTSGGLALLARAAEGWRDRKDALGALMGSVTSQVETIVWRAGWPPAREDKDTLINAVSDLCHFAEETAISRNAPLVLIGLLERSGYVFDLCDPNVNNVDRNATAERQWGRALRLSEAVLDKANNAQDAAAARAERVRFLELLAVHYRDKQRYSLQWDMEDELIDAYDQAGDTLAAARVGLRLARALVEAGKRFDAAEEYLVSADQAFQALSDLDTKTAAQHATALELLATVHHHRGNPELALICQERAAALCQPSPAAVP